MALLSMQPRRFIRVRGKKAPGLRWPQVMDHRQHGFSFERPESEAGQCWFWTEENGNIGNVQERMGAKGH